MPGRSPTAKDFPPKLSVSIVAPPEKDAPANILILLHGLGDKKEAFSQLASQMKLPETVGIAFDGPNTLLDLDGRHWGDDIIFDTTNGGLDPDGGLKAATELLKLVIKESLIEKCQYTTREIVIFGYGQGGMLALNTAITMHQDINHPKESELGGVISIGAGLPGDAPASLINKCKTPILVCAGNSQTIVTSTAEDKLKRNFEHVEIKHYRRPGDTMPANRDEMMPVMQFFARRLKSRKGVPEGSIEVS